MGIKPALFLDVPEFGFKNTERGYKMRFLNNNIFLQMLSISSFSKVCFVDNKNFGPIYNKKVNGNLSNNIERFRIIVQMGVACILFHHFGVLNDVTFFRM